MVLSIFVGVLDSFGLAMFLPLFQMISDEGTIDANGLGNLSFLITGLESFGISISLLSVLLFMLLFFSFKGLFKYFLEIYRIILEQRFIKTIRLELLNGLNKINFKAFTTTDVGRIQNTMSTEVEKVSFAYRAYFISFEHAILLSIYIGFAFFIDSQFAILVIIGGILTNFIFRNIYQKTIGQSKLLTFESNEYQGRIIQHINNFKYLKATGLAEHIGERVEESIHNIEKNRKEIGFLASIMSASREPLLIMVISVVILVQVYFLGGELATILLSLLFFYRGLQSLTMLQNDWNRFLGVSGSLYNLKDFQSYLHSNKSNVIGTKSFSFKRSIELIDVDFSYENKEILKNINLKIDKNRTIAFVGESGSGKTTLVNIIARLLPVNSGRLLLDNVCFEEIDIRSFQNRIGYITQEPVIFNDTIYNNITLWSEPNVNNNEKFQKVIEKASLGDFIRDLENREFTVLGNNGINLSGGQKQRISIARELFKEIDLLILDEATSALDSETEREIQSSIHGLKGEYTILIIAHRLSTIKDADQVVIMKNGEINDVDTFENLINKHSYFRRMVELQDI